MAKDPPHEDFLLISFYNRGTTRQPMWEVYGHTAPGDNEMLLGFNLKSEAIEYAHSFHRTPVIQGQDFGTLVEALLCQYPGKRPPWDGHDRMSHEDPDGD